MGHHSFNSSAVLPEPNFGPYSLSSPLPPTNKKIPGSAPEGDLMLDIGSGNVKMVFVLLCGNQYTALETAY